MNYPHDCDFSSTIQFVPTYTICTFNPTLLTYRDSRWTGNDTKSALLSVHDGVHCTFGYCGKQLILLIDMMKHLRKKFPNKNIREVVLEAATNRLRPILLTTVTTVAGMFPLTYAGDLWAPLAYAVMFGLMFSVVITLVLIPIIYLNNPGKISK